LRLAYGTGLLYCELVRLFSVGLFALRGVGSLAHFGSVTLLGLQFLTVCKFDK
jgi:hypothetical protein